MEPSRTSSRKTSGKPIKVEFVVLHYTAETLEATLQIFSSADPKTGAHLVIAPDGRVFETTACWDGDAIAASHAGRSRWNDGAKLWEEFNDFSIGIEIVNSNGNILEYTDAQYEALADVLRHLGEAYPALRDPGRIIGHEQIAGWRGKADPGAKFEWSRLYSAVYGESPRPERRASTPPDLVDALAVFEGAAPRRPEENAGYWRAVNYVLEKSVALVHRADLETPAVPPAQSSGG